MVAAGFFGPFVERMAVLGVTEGCGDGSRFCPDDSVNRAQMAVFLSRAYYLPDGPVQGFADVAPDVWYADAVAALAASGITRGCGDGTRFCPGDHTTRAQMATFLYRAEEQWHTAAGAKIPSLCGVGELCGGLAVMAFFDRYSDFDSSQGLSVNYGDGVGMAEWYFCGFRLSPAGAAAPA